MGTYAVLLVTVTLLQLVFLRHALMTTRVAKTRRSRSALEALSASTQAEGEAVNMPVPLRGVPYRINQLIDPTRVQSVRVRHIQLSTQDMANECKAMLAAGTADFVTIAASLSSCEGTRAKGGDLGWSPESSLSREVSEQTLYTPEILNAAMSMNKGDLRVVSAAAADGNVWHVLQLIDVITTLSPEMQRRRINNFQQLLRSDVAPTTKTYSIDTMGCQMNSADSERIEGQLVALGYTKATDPANSNLVVLNTCSIRDHAEQKVYSHVGPHALRKRRGEDVSIIVAGCVAQQEGDSIIKRFPEVDIVMGPQYANRFSDLLESVFEGQHVVATDPLHQMEDSFSAKRSSDISAFVNVIYGCNERCTYCVVPNTRGVEQSRTRDAIVAEVKSLVENGYVEVTLLGQNIDSWGRDMVDYIIF